jgi:hypothetical protein
MLEPSSGILVADGIDGFSDGVIQRYPGACLQRLQFGFEL